jgi:YfiH family protein
VTRADRGSGALSLDDAIGSAREAGQAGRRAGVDALITATPGVVLVILTADCVPIVLHDPVAGVLACVHAGWRGTAAGVTAAAVAAMQRQGARPSDVVAGIGPAIGADRYQVGPDVHEAVTRSFGPAAPGFIRPDPSAPGHWLLDLPSANRHALRQAGVPDGRIHATDIPTGPGPGHFFSDRTARPCGRLALVAWLRPGGER